eukprot:gene22008-29067_t
MRFILGSAVLAICHVVLTRHAAADVTTGEVSQLWVHAPRNLDLTQYALKEMNTETILTLKFATPSPQSSLSSGFTVSLSTKTPSRRLRSLLQQQQEIVGHGDDGQDLIIVDPEAPILVLDFGSKRDFVAIDGTVPFSTIVFIINVDGNTPNISASEMQSLWLNKFNDKGEKNQETMENYFKSCSYGKTEFDENNAVVDLTDVSIPVSGVTPYSNRRYEVKSCAYNEMLAYQEFAQKYFLIFPTWVNTFWPGSMFPAYYFSYRIKIDYDDGLDYQYVNRISIHQFSGVSIYDYQKPILVGRSGVLLGSTFNDTNMGLVMKFVAADDKAGYIELCHYDETYETNCADGIDNDCNGLEDCCPDSNTSPDSQGPPSDTPANSPGCSFKLVKAGGWCATSRGAWGKESTFDCAEYCVSTAGSQPPFCFDYNANNQHCECSAGEDNIIDTEGYDAFIYTCTDPYAPPPATAAAVVCSTSLIATDMWCSNTRSNLGQGSAEECAQHCMDSFGISPPFCFDHNPSSLDCECAEDLSTVDSAPSYIAYNYTCSDTWCASSRGTWDLTSEAECAQYCLTTFGSVPPFCFDFNPTINHCECSKGSDTSQPSLGYNSFTYTCTQDKRKLLQELSRAVYTAQDSSNHLSSGPRKLQAVVEASNDARKSIVVLEDPGRQILPNIPSNIVIPYKKEYYKPMSELVQHRIARNLLLSNEGQATDSFCGNKICEGGEDGASCAMDCCPKAVCGDGICQAYAGEECESCPEDCAGDLDGEHGAPFCCGAYLGCEHDERCTGPLLVRGKRCTGHLLISSKVHHDNMHSGGDGMCQAYAGEECESCPELCL